MNVRMKTRLTENPGYIFACLIRGVFVSFNCVVILFIFFLELLWKELLSVLVKCYIRLVGN